MMTVPGASRVSSDTTVRRSRSGSTLPSAAIGWSGAIMLFEGNALCGAGA